MKTTIVLLGALALAGCGMRGDLKPAANHTLPVKPYGAVTAPSAADLVTADAQSRPERSDEILRSSDKRAGDAFDLPPP